MSLSKCKQQHTDHTLKEKTEILHKLECGVKAIDYANNLMEVNLLYQYGINKKQTQRHCQC